jgi:hypothetical protein
MPPPQGAYLVSSEIRRRTARKNGPHVLLAILTAHSPSRNSYVEFARNTWVRKCPFDHVFIYGGGKSSLPDELCLECPDSYEQLAFKDQAAFRFALDKGYDFCLRCCDDTFVYPCRLEGLEKYDYAGKLIGLPPVDSRWKWHPWGEGYMHGGCGVWLSAKAMKVLIDDKLGEYIPANQKLKDAYIDDIWMGEVLQGNLPWGDPRREGKTYSSRGIAMQDHPGFVSIADDKFHSTIPNPIAVHYHSAENRKYLSI